MKVKEVYIAQVRWSNYTRISEEFILNEPEHDGFEAVKFYNEKGFNYAIRYVGDVTQFTEENPFVQPDWLPDCCYLFAGREDLVHQVPVLLRDSEISYQRIYAFCPNLEVSSDKNCEKFIKAKEVKEGKISIIPVSCHYVDSSAPQYASGSDKVATLPLSDLTANDFIKSFNNHFTFPKDYIIDIQDSDLEFDSVFSGSISAKTAEKFMSILMAATSGEISFDNGLHTAHMKVIQSDNVADTPGFVYNMTEDTCVLFKGYFTEVNFIKFVCPKGKTFKFGFCNNFSRLAHDIEFNLPISTKALKFHETTEDATVGELCINSRVIVGNEVGSKVRSESDSCVICGEQIETAIIRGKGELIVNNSNPRGICIGVPCHDGMSYGRWSLNPCKLKKLIIDGVKVICFTGERMLAIGSYGRQLDIEIKCINGGEYYGPEALGQPVIDQQAYAPVGSTKISNNTTYKLVKKNGDTVTNTEYKEYQEKLLETCNAQETNTTKTMHAF